MGEQLNSIFHDLYVGMAQASHQNNVLNSRLNQMQRIVTDDDDNRAQIAQHIAGLRSAAEQVRCHAPVSAMLNTGAHHANLSLAALVCTDGTGG